MILIRFPAGERILFTTEYIPTLETIQLLNQQVPRILCPGVKPPELDGGL
jgi:hypothetical protein